MVGWLVGWIYKDSWSCDVIFPGVTWTTLRTSCPSSSSAFSTPWRSPHCRPRSSTSASSQAHVSATPCPTSVSCPSPAGVCPTSWACWSLPPWRIKCSVPSLSCRGLRGVQWCLYLYAHVLINEGEGIWSKLPRCWISVEPQTNFVMDQIYWWWAKASCSRGYVKTH